MKRYKVAVAGAGFIGAVHIETLRRLNNVEVAALCDAADPQGRAAALNIPGAYADFEDMLDREKPDAVHICTPNHTHYALARSAIRRGVPLICEKPFTTTVEQAEELVALARQQGVAGAVNLHNRFYPMAAQMREMVRAGELGRLFSFHGGYVQDWMLYETDYSWRLDRSQVGTTRAVADIGSHWMDLVEHTAGQRIKRLNAVFHTAHQVRKKPMGERQTFAAADRDGSVQEVPVDTEDEAALLVELESGAIGTGIISMVYAGHKNTTTLTLAGSRCSANWNSERINELFIGHRDQPSQLLTRDHVLMHPGAGVMSNYPSGHVEGFADAFKNAFRNFYGSLGGEVEPRYATLEDGLRQMRLCEAAARSAASGEWVEV